MINQTPAFCCELHKHYLHARRYFFARVNGTQVYLRITCHFSKTPFAQRRHGSCMSHLWSRAYVIRAVSPSRWICMHRCVYNPDLQCASRRMLSSELPAILCTYQYRCMWEEEPSPWSEQSYTRRPIFTPLLYTVDPQTQLHIPFVRCYTEAFMDFPSSRPEREESVRILALAAPPLSIRVTVFQNLTWRGSRHYRLQAAAHQN